VSNAIWMIRSGRQSVLAEMFRQEKRVAISIGQALGQLPDKPTRLWLLEQFQKHHPSWKKGKQQNAASQLYRFLAEITVGDQCITYDANLRLYYIGNITSPARWDSECEKPFVRDVTWTHRVSRDSLPIATRNSLGSTLTLFRLNKTVAQDLTRHQIPIDAPESVLPTISATSTDEGDKTSFEELHQEMLDRAAELIEDRLSGLDFEEMERLVAGILRAMGYRTRVTPKGPDRGLDIFASPDGLGLEEPRIFVEVKHRPNTAMGAPDIRSFLGGRRQGDRCLYVSTGGFTREARYEADRASIPITLVNLPELRRLLLDHYDRADEETRTLIPLARLYWPIE
jgi:restriction system protein